MLWSLLLLALPAVYAVVNHPAHDDNHQMAKPLPNTWYHPDDHPVHDLFKRASGDGTTYPTVGSPTWSAPFPTWSPDVSQLPNEWVAALNAAVAAGKIPNIPQTSNTPGVNPVYPSGFDPMSPAVCSATYKCRIPGDIWNAPDGYFAVSFDDGPTPASPKLLQFLNANNESATHFVIGVYILQNPQIFSDIFNSGHDIAVHTWTHPYMTTLSNLQIVAQLGWTAEIIRNSTGGRVPRYWRPPYGDSDTRVSAIAKEVFGLQTIIWSEDTSDWSLITGGTTSQAIHNLFGQWLTRASKSPGILTLEHETSDQSVQAFIDNYPMIKGNGWKTGSLTSLIGNSTYQNSKDSSSPVTFDGSILVGAAQQNSSTSAPGSQTSQSQSTQTQTVTRAGGIQSSQTSNAASALVSRNVSWSLCYVLLSLCSPAILAPFLLFA